LDRYRANPVLLFGHRHDQPPVGKAEAIWSDGQALRARLRFVPPAIFPFAGQVAAMVKAGFLNSLSVGFRSLAQTKNAEGGFNISAAELLELSIVALPALPQASIDRTAAARVQKWLDDRVVLHLRDDDDDRIVLRITDDKPRRGRR
jgi:HK97 family phage prohead protease